MTETVVDRIFKDCQSAGEILTSANETSLKISFDDHNRKTILLSAASHFEARLSHIVEEFADEASAGNPLVNSLVKEKVITRQYHTWFDWNANNANRFFSMFGKAFKEHMEQRIRDDDNLQAAVIAFIELGRERNRLVHSDFGSHLINKTSDEVFDLYQTANLFVSCVGAELRSCSNALLRPLTNSERGIPAV